jgi:hypothetical protein
MGFGFRRRDANHLNMMIDYVINPELRQQTFVQREHLCRNAVFETELNLPHFDLYGIIKQMNRFYLLCVRCYQ